MTILARGRPWTEEEVRRVVKHEIPDKELAEQLGRTINSIRHKRMLQDPEKRARHNSKRKLPPLNVRASPPHKRVWTDEQIEAVLAKEVTDRELAKAWGIPRSSIKKKRYELTHFRSGDKTEVKKTTFDLEDTGEL